MLLAFAPGCFGEIVIPEGTPDGETSAVDAASGDVDGAPQANVDGAPQAQIDGSSQAGVDGMPPTACRPWLDYHGVAYEVGPANPGVNDPVTITLPLAGMRYRYVSFDTPRETIFMDCELARTLVRAAPLLAARDIVEVADIGVYNYRCIGGGEPPDCPNGISQHAYALGIDIAGFETADGTFFSVNDDWIIDPESEPTCEAATEPGKDRFLHEVICELKANAIFNIVLTPNYNADHRNHFHSDLTAGGDFIEREAGGSAVDVGADRH